MNFLKKSLLGIVAISLVGFIFTEFRYPTPDTFPYKDFETPILIAHAGGAIDGYSYTNSKEAIENAIVNGYNFIELDLRKTSDGRLGAAHDVGDLDETTGFQNTPNQVLKSSDNYTKQKVFGLFTPLLDEDINKFFEINANTFLVTDKIQDLDFLSEKVTLNKDRMLLEVSTYATYAMALRKGYKYPMLTIENLEALKHYKKYMFLRKIKTIVIYTNLILEAPKELAEIHDMGVAILACTSNDKDFIQKYGKDFITGFYTDSITNSDIKLQY